MNKRQKKWQKEVNEGINYYEFKYDNTYDYYGKLNKRHHIKSTRGKWHYTNLILRWIVGLTLIAITIKNYFGL